MKRIGEIAARLVANPVELVAAANQKRSTESKKAGSPKGEASRPVNGSVKPPGGAVSSYDPRTRIALTVVRCGPTHPPVASKRRPRLAGVGPHLATVDGVRVHATGPR